MYESDFEADDEGWEMEQRPQEEQKEEQEQEDGEDGNIEEGEKFLDAMLRRLEKRPQPKLIQQVGEVCTVDRIALEYLVNNRLVEHLLRQLHWEETRLESLTTLELVSRLSENARQRVFADEIGLNPETLIQLMDENTSKSAYWTAAAGLLGNYITAKRCSLSPNEIRSILRGVAVQSNLSVSKASCELLYTLHRYGAQQSSSLHKRFQDTIRRAIMDFSLFAVYARAFRGADACTQRLLRVGALTLCYLAGERMPKRYEKGFRLDRLTTVEQLDPRLAFVLHAYRDTLKEPTRGSDDLRRPRRTFTATGGKRGSSLVQKPSRDGKNCPLRPQTAGPKREFSNKASPRASTLRDLDLRVGPRPTIEREQDTVAPHQPITPKKETEQEQIYFLGTTDVAVRRPKTAPLLPACSPSSCKSKKRNGKKIKATVQKPSCGASVKVYATTTPRRQKPISEKRDEKHSVCLRAVKAVAPDAFSEAEVVSIVSSMHPRAKRKLESSKGRANGKEHIDTESKLNASTSTNGLEIGMDDLLAEFQKMEENQEQEQQQLQSSPEHSPTRHEDDVSKEKALKVSAQKKSPRTSRKGMETSFHTEILDQFQGGLTFAERLREMIESTQESLQEGTYHSKQEKERVEASVEASTTEAKGEIEIERDVSLQHEMSQGGLQEEEKSEAALLPVRSDEDQHDRDGVQDEEGDEYEDEFEDDT